MKEYYDRNASQPLFEIGQRVWVYTPKTKKGLSKKLLYNWFGPYRIVEQSSPVHYRLRSKNNKKVTFSVHANRMKPFVDPALRPIEPPIDDDPTEPYLDESDIPAVAPSKGIQESRGFWIPHCGFRIPRTGFRIPAQWIPDSQKGWIPNFFVCFNAFLRISFSCSNRAVSKNVVRKQNKFVFFFDLQILGLNVLHFFKSL